MNFLIDNALPPRLATLLAEAGHDATHVRHYGMQAAPDEEILAKSAADNRILVSADSDFATLLALQSAAKPSFFLFREPDIVTAEQYAAALLANLATLEPDLLRGCVAAFRRGHIRIRTLPIGST